MRSYSTQSKATTALAGSTLDAVYSDSTVAGYAVETTGGQVETVGEIEDALPQDIVLTKNSLVGVFGLLQVQPPSIEIGRAHV